MSGLVHPPYAIPGRGLPIKTVQDRLYRGPCMAPDQAEPFATFNAKQPAVMGLLDTIPGMDKASREDAKIVSKASTRPRRIRKRSAAYSSPTVPKRRRCNAEALGDADDTPPVSTRSRRGERRSRRGGARTQAGRAGTRGGRHVVRRRGHRANRRGRRCARRRRSAGRDSAGGRRDRCQAALVGRPHASGPDRRRRRSRTGFTQGARPAASARGEAASAGGRVHVLLGNHEVARMLGDLRYTTPGEYQAFVTPDSEDVRQRFIDSVKAADREQLLKDTPLGQIEMLVEFGLNGTYGSGSGPRHRRQDRRRALRARRHRVRPSRRSRATTSTPRSVAS